MEKPTRYLKNTNRKIPTMAPNNVKGAVNKDKSKQPQSRKKLDRSMSKAAEKTGKKLAQSGENNPWIHIPVRSKTSSLKKKLEQAASSKHMDIEVKKEVIKSSNEIYLTEDKTGDEYFNGCNDVIEIQEENENMSVESENKQINDTEMNSSEMNSENIKFQEKLETSSTNEFNLRTNDDASDDMDVDSKDLDGNQSTVDKRKLIEPNAEQSPKKKIVDKKKASELNTGPVNEPNIIVPETKKVTAAITPEKRSTSRIDWNDLNEEDELEEELIEPTKNQTENKEESNSVEPIVNLTKQVSIHSFAEKIKGKKKQPKGKCIRFRFTFNAKKGGDKPQVLALLTNIMEIANIVDKEAMIMPWQTNGSELGPIDRNDVIYQHKLSVTEAKRYLDLPIDVQRIGFTGGKTEYGLGVCITTDMEARVFKNSWDLTKKDRIGNGKKFIPMRLAELQNSPKAFLVGVAAGSTEGIEMDSINKELGSVTGIKGIGVSYQSFHQPGITPALWKEANKIAGEATNDKKSRVFIKTKYAWAPEGMCIYVPEQKDVASARKILIAKYGECDKTGNLPIWPGGSRMRFIPLKSLWIKNAKTRTKVEKRVKYHIYSKGNEYEEPTSFRNIGDTIKTFNGKSFQEMIMDIDSKTKPGLKLFRHFKYVWTPDPKKTKWALSVHKVMTVEAAEKLQNLQEEFQKTYGEEVNKFFQEEQKRTMYASKGKPLKFNLDQDDEDDWFKTDNDVLSLQERLIMVEGIPENMDNNKNETEDITDLSWGSPTSFAALSQGTEMDTNTVPDNDIEVQGGNDTEVTSTLTQSTAEADRDVVRQRKFNIRKALAERGISLPHQKLIMEGNEPYDFVMGNFTKLDYNHDLMVELIMTCHKIWKLDNGQDVSLAEIESSEPNLDGDSGPSIR